MVATKSSISGLPFLEALSYNSFEAAAAITIPNDIVPSAIIARMVYANILFDQCFIFFHIYMLFELSLKFHC